MTAKTSDHDSLSLAMQVSRRSILANLLLSAGKLAAGIIGNSAAMVSDAVHSASDVFSTVVVMLGMRLSARRADQDHQYGHERLECIAAILLAVVLALTGLGIGVSAASTIRDAEHTTIAVPGLVALIAAAVSIIVKEGMYWYTRWAAKKINSPALMADAWHHRSDALSSVGSLVGILGARMGYPILDPIAGLVICLFILKASYDIFVSAVNQLTDHACPVEVEAEMSRLIQEQEGVLHLDLLKTRQFGPKVYVDVEVSANGSMSLVKAHAIAQRVHDCIEQSFPNVKHCMVHVNPMKEPTEEE